MKSEPKTQPVCISVSLSPAPSQMCLFIFRQRNIIEKKKKKNIPTHRCRLYRPVSLSVRLGQLLRKTWTEPAMEPCSPHHWHHTDRAGGVTESNRQPHFLSLRYLSGCRIICLARLPPPACLPALRKPANATLLGLLPLWTAAQWKKRRRRT